ncbi:FhaA domain-containing protein [Streptomyces sp. NPDC048376]|uniref:FhaA domain-containing protein n=1 Tax=Streptomyces sp. NPDC048376 TaxID=3154926 RepID=UPI003423C39D
MGFLESERVMEQWVMKVWSRLSPARQPHGEALATLLRQCDENALIVGRRRVVAPNAYVVELLPQTHRQISDSPLPVAPALAAHVRRHAAERGYTFAGPVTVHLHPAPDDRTDRFRVHSRIAPAKGR